MSKSIKIKIKKAEGKIDPGTSKFLGSPVLPEEWINEFEETVMFFFQINLEEIKDLDKDNLLPHTGYLYFFLDTADGYFNLKPIVRYYDGLPCNVVDEFNSIVPEFEQYVKDFPVEFELADEKEGGTKLFGVPADYNYEEETAPLLLQFDPLDSAELELFPTLDGMLYFFFNEKNPKNFKKVKLLEDFS